MAELKNRGWANTTTLYFASSQMPNPAMHALPIRAHPNFLLNPPPPGENFTFL